MTTSTAQGSAIPETSPAPVVSVRNVSHYYGSRDLRRQILFDISVDFNPAEIVILTGPSGSGKTTLLTLAGALRKVEHGSLKVLGQELNGASSAASMAVRRQIGYIFQSHNLLDSLTAWQNVQMALGTPHAASPLPSKQRCLDMLEAVGLKAFANRFPPQLSGGQRQRVAIARALVRRPKLVLADEPTAALDKVSGREVVEILQNLAKEQGCTILLVTHDNRILDVADRILNLEDGRIGSFAAGMTASAGRLLTAFAKMNRKGDIFQYVDRVSESQFTEMLENMTVELEQLLKTLSLGSADAVGTMVNQLLDAVTMKIRHLLNADRATLFMVDETNQMLRSRIAESGGGEPLLISIPITAGIAGMVAREDITLNIPDPYAHPAFDRSVDMRTGYVTRNLLCMPIHDRAKKVFAVAQLLNRKEEGPFTREDEQKFRAFAGPIGLILENCLRLESPVGSGTGAHSN